MALDYAAIDRNAIVELKRVLRPINYRELFRSSVHGFANGYSATTDPVEKFRQHYAETEHPAITLIPGGDLALRYWFPINHTAAFISPEPMVIQGDCLVSYNAGYEHAKREPHLYDWYDDGKTKKRWQRRMTAFQFESQVRTYYERNWPRFYRPPTNHMNWTQPASDDFQLQLPDGVWYRIDTKSASYQELGQDCYQIRKIERENMMYLAGNWDEQESVAIVKGIISGKWLKQVAGEANGCHIKDGLLMSVEVLSVMLNMASCCMSYKDAYLALAKQKSALHQG